MDTIENNSKRRDGLLRRTKKHFTENPYFVPVSGSLSDVTEAEGAEIKFFRSTY